MRQHADVFAANFSSNLLWQNCFAPKKSAFCAEPRRAAAGILDVCQGGATMGLRETRLLRRMFSYARRPKGCCFFIELVRSRSLSPLAGEIRPQAPTPCRHRAASFLFALAVYVSTLFFRGTFEVQTALCAAAHTSETATRYIAHEMPISGHNCRYMRNYRDGISAKRNISSREHHFLSNAVAGCRTKMLVFDKLPLHLLSVCGIFDSVKAVRGVYMGNCVPLKLC